MVGLSDFAKGDLLWETGADSEVRETLEGECMCCDDGHGGQWPDAVERMLARYVAASAEVDFDWGHEAFDALRFTRYTELPTLLAGLAGASADGTAKTLDDALWDATSETLPLGLVGVEVDEDAIRIRCSQRTLALPGTRVHLGVMVRSQLDAEAKVILNGLPRVVPAGRTVFVHIDVDDEGLVVEVDGRRTGATVVDRPPAGRLRLTAEQPCRWSVVDDRGGAWFPDGVLEKWDVHGRPWFHCKETRLNVPAVPMHITASRGMEYRPVSTTALATAHQELTVELSPQRRYDAAARGWFGGDLHVHLNYSGDHVARPEHAAAAQRGEGLHLLNLVAGNMSTSLIYDREAFEYYAGQDLPWSDDQQVARWGVEYRNDLLGHFHALGANARPSRYNSGHARSEELDDWPPNAAACEELKAFGATIGYTHPTFAPLDGSPARPFSPPYVPHAPEARELVADAALGLVDSMDLLGPASSFEGNVELYHHLLNSGIRLAATAGTDTMMSVARWDTYSNPPGWARAYADLQGEPLSVAAWQSAVRSGRTFVTNGPWLEFDIDGRHGPGAVVECARGATLRLTAKCHGEEASILRILGPDGVLASVDVLQDVAELSMDVTIEEPSWFAAEASGGPHPQVLHAVTYAHTSPVYVDVAARRIGRAQDARWCLDWLDHLESLARSGMHFSEPSQLGDLLHVINDAREYYRNVEAQSALDP